MEIIRFLEVITDDITTVVMYTCEVIVVRIPPLLPPGLLFLLPRDNNRVINDKFCF